MSENDEINKAKELVELMTGGCCMCPHDSKAAAIVCAEEFIKFAEEDFCWDLKDKWERIKSEIEKIEP